MSEASPRFRQDLTVSPTEADGVACVDVRDPKTGASFRLYDFEYQLALQLNGQPVRQVTDWASKTYGADLTPEGISEFAARLGELGFLEKMGTLAGFPYPPATGSRSGAPSASSPLSPATVEDEAPEAAAEEWESAQGAKTAQFVPDRAMLDSGPEPTPVAPLDLLKLAAGSASAPEGTPAAVTAEITAQAIAELPSEALDSEPVAPVPSVVIAPAAAPKADAAAKSSWATDLDGALQSSDSPPAVRPPPAAKGDALVPALPVQVAPPPPGLSERRQPPAPRPW